MIDENAKAILKQALPDSTPEEIENLRWHLRNETPVICHERQGFSSLSWVEDGAG